MMRPAFARALRAGLALCALAAPRVAIAQDPPASAARPPQSHDSLWIDERAKLTSHTKSQFGPDPDYSGLKTDTTAQKAIYGGKYLNTTQRPLLELGRELYDNGPLSRGWSIMGSHNEWHPQLLVYGDLRLAGGLAGSNATPPPHQGADSTLAAGRLNLDVDLRLTATERFHALFRPFEKNGQISRFSSSGDSSGFHSVTDTKPVALFFEGDMGAILGGISGRDAPFDMPISVGLMPLIFHNGTWIEDAFTGAAFTIPAKNSAELGWSNFDFTFFYGMDKVSTPKGGVGTATHSPIIGGMNAFIEANHGYWEFGYAYLQSDSGALKSLHSVALSYTRRYGGWLSNSFRYIGAFGQHAAVGNTTPSDTAGHLILIENSLISSHPTTFVPYFNLFVGLGKPTSAARDAGAGGVLKNTGINYEGDALTAFPSLDATAQDAAGGAFGINLLGSNLNSQFVIEAAATQPLKTSTAIPGSQYGLGVRMQRALTNALIFRLDGMYGKRTGLTDIHGARVELRYKF